MSKQSKKLFELADLAVGIYQSGKIKFKKGRSVSVTAMSQPSIEGTIGSRFTTLEDHSETLLEPNGTLSVNSFCSDIMRQYKMSVRLGSTVTPTICHVITRKEALSVFDFLDTSIVGKLLRVSNLPTIYSAIKNQWAKLLQNSDGHDCILYVPGITIFTDENCHINLESSHDVNLLLYVTKRKGSKPEKEEEAEPVMDSDRTYDIVLKLMECAVRLKCKNLLIDPYCCSKLLSDPSDTAAAFGNAIAIDRNKNNLDSIDFCIDDDDLFITFGIKMNKKGPKAHMNGWESDTAI